MMTKARDASNLPEKNKMGWKCQSQYYRLIEKENQKHSLSTAAMWWPLTLSGPGGGSEARMAKLTAANQKPLIQ